VQQRSRVAVAASLAHGPQKPPQPRVLVLARLPLLAAQRQGPIICAIAHTPKSATDPTQARNCCRALPQLQGLLARAAGLLALCALLCLLAARAQEGARVTAPETKGGRGLHIGVLGQAAARKGGGRRAAELGRVAQVGEQLGLKVMFQRAQGSTRCWRSLGSRLGLVWQRCSSVFCILAGSLACSASHLGWVLP
jgi:hypothetical protein